jgi:alpha-D-xyloside xylohydrolase
MTMRVYLPEGLWYDFYTYDCYEGGRIITIDVTMDHIPVFAKAGAIIPTVEVMQYVDEKKDAPYEILVFAGADGVFELYDDAGDGYEYENGAYSLIKLQYNEQSGEVSAMQLEDEKIAHEYSVKIIN